MFSEYSEASAHICINSKQSLAIHNFRMLSLSHFQETLKLSQCLKVIEQVYQKDNFLVER